MTGMLALPEGCIVAVISFTTPRDACRLACVSTTFRSAADSDVVWDCFLGPEYLSTISSLSKKGLYHLLTSHNLIHNGRLSFWFDLPSGKKCYMISSKELYIVGSDYHYMWEFYSIAQANHYFGIPDCRFPEVLVRFDVIPFVFGGKISTSLLSPMTTYVAYLVFAENLISCVDDNPAEVVVGLAGSNNGQNRSIYLHWVHLDEDDDDFIMKKREDGWLEASNNGQNRTIYLHRVHLDRDDDGFFPKKRADGWLESELGEFFNGGDVEGELSMTIKTCCKDCLLIQGIEIRPKKE